MVYPAPASVCAHGRDGRPPLLRGHVGVVPLPGALATLVCEQSNARVIDPAHAVLAGRVGERFQYTDRQGRVVRLASHEDHAEACVRHALCLVSHYPLWNAFRRCLLTMFSDHRGKIDSGMEPSIYAVLRRVRGATFIGERAPSCF